MTKCRRLKENNSANKLKSNNNNNNNDIISRFNKKFIRKYINIDLLKKTWYKHVKKDVISQNNIEPSCAWHKSINIKQNCT